MVDVRMRQYYGIEIRNRYRKLPVLFIRLFSPALKHAAVQRNCMSVDMKQMAGPGDLAGSACKCDFQLFLAFGDCTSGKKDREPLFVLRHERRLPSATASLVQEVGESILVLTGMPRELDHHSLVFFHADGR